MPDRIDLNELTRKYPLTADKMIPVTSRTPRLLRLTQAAKEYGLSAKRLRALIRAGELPFICFEDRGPWWVDCRDLDRWIETRKETKE